MERLLPFFIQQHGPSHNPCDSSFAPDRPIGTPQASCSRRQPAQSCSDAASPPQPAPHADLQRQQTLAAQRIERDSTAAQLHSIETPARQTKGSLKQLSMRFSSTASRAGSLSLLLSKLARQTRNHYKSSSSEQMWLLSHYAFVACDADL